MLTNKVLILVLFYFISSWAQLNKDVAGPYNIVVLNCENCLKKATRESIHFNLKLKKINRNTMAVNGNVTLGSPLDDELISTVRLDQFTNGGWKENYFKQDFKKTCTTLKRYAPALMKQALIASNVNPTTCPIAKGNYTMNNFVLKLDIPEVPIFFYNKYRYIATLSLKGKTVACMQSDVDVVPKRSKSKG